MADHNSFFSNVERTWNQYNLLRGKYSDTIPIPQRSYFTPIHTLDALATVLVRPIHCPLWLSVNTALFFLKSLLSIVATLVLLIPALLTTILAPNSHLNSSISTSFKQAAAHAVIAPAMTIIAACAALVSLLFNPIFLLTRCLSTAVEHVNEITESCCGLTIAKF